MFVRLRICCQNLQMIIWLDVNASFVSELGIVGHVNSCDRASAAKSGI